MSVKQAVRVKVAKRITQQRDAESVFEPPALSVEPLIQALPPADSADSAAGHSIETMDVAPGLRSVTPKIQRKESDEGSPAPAPVPAPPPDGSGSGAEELSGGTTGTTNILAPTVSSKTYSGTTLQEVASAMPEEPGSLTFDIAAKADGDPITKATVTVKQVMVLARWAERDKQCKPIQAAWDRFASALRTHEDEHVKINKQQLAKAHDRYVGRPQSETQDVTTELENETFAAGNAFDTQTDHGKTASPSTTIDVGAKCDDKTSSIDIGSGDEEAVQAKLEVSEPGDPDEEEADRVAEQVMRMADPDDAARVGVFGGATVVQRCAACEAEDEKWKTSAPAEDGVRVRRKCAECEEKEKGEGGQREGGEGGEKRERVPRKESNGRPVVEESSRVTAVARSGGQPLDAGTRAFMEPRFGFDFSQVRIHADSHAAEAARSLNAHAYTLGSSVVFGSGQYAPSTSGGRRLLAHELTHVVQQTGAAQTAEPVDPVAAGGAESTVARSRIPVISSLSHPSVQRDGPAPAGPVTPPSPPPPSAGGASPGASGDTDLPAPGASLRLVLSDAEQRLVLTKEDLSEFNLGVGELSTPSIPLGETGISGKITVGSDNPIRVSDVSIALSPIVGLLDAGEVASARAADEKSGKTGSTAGGVIGAGIGGVIGSIGGPLGTAVGANIGARVGASVGQQAGQALGSDRFVRLTLDEGAISGRLKISYNPFLAVELSAVGMSWLVGLKATLQTSLNVSVVPQIDFRGSSIALRFQGGKLAHTEFELKPIVTPSLGLIFDGSGQLLASASLLPILGDKKSASPDNDPGVEVVEVVTAPFKLFEGEASIGGQPDLRAAKGSPFQVLKKGMKAAPGGMKTAFGTYLATGKKQMPFSTPAPTDGEPRSGHSTEEAIPFTWWKPFKKYLDGIKLPQAVFGDIHPARPFPHKKYSSEQRGTDIGLGVDHWPYVGMTLKKKSNARGGEVKEFKKDLDEHGISLDPQYQVDHVIDLMFDGGRDSADNLWPLPADINTKAGGKWSNGEMLVHWTNRKGTPGFKTPPSGVPTGRWFVIQDIQEP